MFKWERRVGIKICGKNVGKESVGGSVEIKESDRKSRKEIVERKVRIKVTYAAVKGCSPFECQCYFISKGIE